jgi:beta-galactosidase
MFDYNTHKDFGSGDKICYHGVLDMFRNAKLAASVYASQSGQSDIFEVSSSLDIGEHPAGNIKDIYVFTNADSVRLYKNDEFVKEFYPCKESYPYLPHPPVRIDDFVGELLEKNENFSHKTAQALKEVLFAVKEYGPNHLPLKYKLKMAVLMLKEHLSLEDGTRFYYKYIGNWGNTVTTYRFEAIKEGRVVKVIEKMPVCSPKLAAYVKDTILHEEETYDVTEIRITAVDEHGNRLPYYQEPVVLKAWGAVELIGPEVISLKGGAAGTYVKTKGISGEGGLTIYQENLGEIKIDFQVYCE